MERPVTGRNPWCWIVMKLDSKTQVTCVLMIKLFDSTNTSCQQMLTYKFSVHSDVKCYRYIYIIKSAMLSNVTFCLNQMKYMRVELQNRYSNQMFHLSWTIETALFGLRTDSLAQTINFKMQWLIKSLFQMTKDRDVCNLIKLKDREIQCNHSLHVCLSHASQPSQMQMHIWCAVVFQSITLLYVYVPSWAWNRSLFEI